jgi:hypothetical protein
VDVINSLYLTNNKAISYLYVQGDAGYDKYTYMLTRDRLSPDLYPVDYYLVPSGIWAPSGYHLVLGLKPPSGATSVKDLRPMLF